jgi:GDP-L-fucose synthase
MKVLITGGNGFLGKHLVKYLRDNTDHILDVPTSRELNLLTETPGEVEIAYFNWQPDAIIHLAGVVGGIGFNQDNQGRLGYDNLKIGMTVLEAARELKVKKLIIVGTTCSYPHTPKTIPFVEDELFDGMPEITNSGYGIAKRTLIKLGIEYSKQYGINVVNLIPTNMVGEYDHFEDNKSHVIPALIKKFENPIISCDDFYHCHCECHNNHNVRHVMACCNNGYQLFAPKKLEVKLWGTGSASRDFLYAGDCARAIGIALEKDVGPEPINLASGKEITIKQLAETIKQVGHYNSDIIWDDTKPDGQPRRCLDISRAKNTLRWEPVIPLDEALKRTIEWYRSQNDK